MPSVVYIWRNLLQRKIRTGLSMLGVSVSVAGIVALISVAHGMRGSVDSYMESSGASLLVFARDVADLIFSSVDEEDIRGVRAIEGVEDVSRSHFYMVKAPRVDGERPPFPILLCFGRYPEERLMAKYDRILEEGELFRKRPEILASRLIADGMGWEVGTKVRLWDEDFEVVGIYNSDIAWENGGILLHADILGEKLGRKDNYTLLFVYTEKGREAEVRDRIRSELDHLTAVRPGDFTDAFSAQLEIVDEFIVIITLIALVVGVLGVLNTMMMSVSERTREIGMLRALGWSRGRVVRTILIEGVLIASIGGAIGLGLGVAGTEAILKLFPDAYLVAYYLPETFLQGAAVALLVGVFAAVYPAYRAANLRPVEALRYE